MMQRVGLARELQGIVSSAVPVVCRLGGIRIVLRSREDNRHGPHFQAMAAERAASIRIGDEHVYASTLTGAELAVVVAWLPADAQNWAGRGSLYKTVAPLV